MAATAMAMVGSDCMQRSNSETTKAVGEDDGDDRARAIVSWLLVGSRSGCSGISIAGPCPCGGGDDGDALICTTQPSVAMNSAGPSAVAA